MKTAEKVVWGKRNGRYKSPVAVPVSHRPSAVRPAPASAAFFKDNVASPSFTPDVGEANRQPVSRANSDSNAAARFGLSEEEWEAFSRELEDYLDGSGGVLTF